MAIEAHDITVFVSLESVATATVVNWIPIPVDCRLVRSVWTQQSAWSDSVGVKITSAKGDLADIFSAPGGGAAGDSHTVEHQDADPNNSFERGGSLAVEVTDPSVGEQVSYSLVLRPY